MIKKFAFSLTFFCFSVFMQGQVGIGTANPHSSSILEIQSTDKGLLVPSMTATEKNGIVTPATGLLIFQTDAPKGFWYYNGSAWVPIGGSGWGLNGDSASAGSFLGTTDNNGLTIATNNASAITVSTSQNVGINKTTPTHKLHISGTAPVLRIVEGNQANKKVLTSDANGLGTWQTKTIATAFTPDNDWLLGGGANSGMTINDYLKHVGNSTAGAVTIGSTATPDLSPAIPPAYGYTATKPYLDIDNGQTTGTTFCIGDTEVITDGNNETYIAASILPYNDNNKIIGGLAGQFNANPNGDQKWSAVYATNSTIQTSDKNLKTNIKPLQYGLNQIMQLQPVTYKWKEENIGAITIPQDQKEVKLGLIAQEVQKIIPEVVYDNSWLPKSETENKPDEYYNQKNKHIGINYEELIAVLVKAKQEQDEELKKLLIETKRLEEAINNQ